MTRPSLSIVDLDDICGQRDDVVVCGVLLAAGTSSRYGEANKLLATLDGDTLVRHAARTLIRSATDDVTVVVGHEADRVRDALANIELETTANNTYRQGQSTSVHEGVRLAQERGADAVLIALGDMPSVSVDSIDVLVEAYERGVGDIIAPACDGHRGNPVLFDERYFDRLADVSGDVGGRELLLSSDDAVLVETNDTGVLRDVDRPSDL